jgi:hypothetical protein
MSAVNQGGASGGAIRLLAPTITGRANLEVHGSHSAGAGRIRCDAINRGGLTLLAAPFGLNGAQVENSQYLPLTFAPNPPTLRIVRVGAIAPVATAGVYSVILPLNSPQSTDVEIEASGFHPGRALDLILKVTPVSGPALPDVPVTINLDAGGAGRGTPSVSFPPNIPHTLNVWTR